ncbi:MAG: hypothetical protein A6F71_09615 [Cycloclasticus sp. symbiont of Poecilosclerida sp. M]|nr:MAG: hypothetical protein A6F71_09615 [Cycloclasticus sp. symbiont of Poecilosclerida sp. M]
MCHCAGAISVGKQFYFEDFLDTVILAVNCSGQESSLDKCAFNPAPPGLSNRNDAGVVCQDVDTLAANCTTGAVRLENGTTLLEGRVEVCVNNAWGTICHDTFSEEEAVIICNLLPYQFNGTCYMV